MVTLTASKVSEHPIPHLCCDSKAAQSFSFEVSQGAAGNPKCSGANLQSTEFTEAQTTSTWDGCCMQLHGMLLGTVMVRGSPERGYQTEIATA